MTCYKIPPCNTFHMETNVVTSFIFKIDILNKVHYYLVIFEGASGTRAYFVPRIVELNSQSVTKYLKYLKTDTQSKKDILRNENENNNN